MARIGIRLARLQREEANRAAECCQGQSWINAESARTITSPVAPTRSAQARASASNLAAPRAEFTRDHPRHQPKTFAAAFAPPLAAIWTPSTVLHGRYQQVAGDLVGVDAVDVGASPRGW